MAATLPLYVRIGLSVAYAAALGLLVVRAYAGAMEAEEREARSQDHSTTPRTER